MKDEIKEILDKLYLDFEKAGLTAPEYSNLRDYITNLQEEVEDLRYDIKGYEQERTNFYKSIHTSIVQKKQLTNKLNKLTNKYNDLQEENERLKELIDCDNEEYDIQEMIINQQKSELLEKEDYKSRCEKAIDYINQNKHLSMFADCREPEEDWNYDLEINPRDLLNILQGVGKDE